jgi:hypothetical protein
VTIRRCTLQLCRVEGERVIVMGVGWEAGSVLRSGGVGDLSNCLAQFGGGRASRGGAKRDSPGQRRANFNNFNKSRKFRIRISLVKKNGWDLARCFYGGDVYVSTSGKIDQKL